PPPHLSAFPTRRSSDLLVQGPFVSLSEAFAKGDLVQKLTDQGTLHHAMPGLIGYPSMWKHQQQVLEAVKTGNHVPVSTGTGSGKDRKSTRLNSSHQIIS